MADQKELPEGTDTVISGAAVESENEEQLIVRQPGTRDRMIEKVREGRGKLAGQAADKTRGLVGQGLERSSEALLSSVPMPDPERKAGRIVLKGEVANPANPPSGCAFHPRCPLADEKSRTVRPEPVRLPGGRFVACHRFSGEPVNG